MAAPDAAGLSDVLYATLGWDDADERTMGTLLDLGLQPVIASMGRDVADADALQAALHDADAHGRRIVVSPSAAVTVAAIPASAFVLAPTIDLASFPFHAPWIDAFVLGVPPHAHLVLSLRAHRTENRIDEVIAAFARVPRRTDVHEDFPDPFLIIGHGGPATSALREAARSAGVIDRTRITGPVDADDLVPLLGRASCFVTAAVDDRVPVSLLQAMACGTPVIAADTPAVRTWIDDGVTGFRYPAGDVAALTRLLVEVTARYPLEVTRAARDRVEADADWATERQRLTAHLTRTA
jgi:glycosyltransferase involved in cell wall biosynthesis